MEDVELLVDCFYAFEAKVKAEEEEKDKEEMELIAEAGEEVPEAEPEKGKKLPSNLLAPPADDAKVGRRLSARNLIA